MKVYSKVLILLLFIYGCHNADVLTPTQQLKNCNVGYLLFSDITQSTPSSSVIFPPNNGGNFFNYKYQNNRLIRVNGGFSQLPSYMNFPSVLFSADMVYDSIVYVGEDINLYQKYYNNNSIIENKYNPTIFTIDTKKQLKKIVKRDDYPNGYELYYTYADNQIIEKDVTGKILRTFYFENENLTKIVSQYVNSQGIVTSKKETLFQNYDDNPNPFRNLFYVNGAFYRAFSKNNYASYTMNQYTLLDDGTFGLNGTYWHTLPIQYNGNNYPMFGDYE